VSADSHADAGDGSEDLLGSSAEFLRVVVDSALAAVVVMNDRGIVMGWGRRAEETFGLSRAQALGQLLVNLIVPPQYRAAHNAGLDRYRETGEGPVLGKVIELSALHADGHEFPAEIAISPAAVVGGRTTFIAFVRDISDRHEAARRQDELFSSAADAVKALRDFASLTAHELRTPLAVANGYASLLRDGSLGTPPESWVQPLDTIAAKVREAVLLVDQLLETSRAEGSALRPHFEAVDLGEMCLAAVERARAWAGMVGSAVALRVPDDKVLVEADREMCGRIVDNLLNNAISHAGEGSRIDVEIAGGAAPALTVSDDGVGIAPDLRERIFERFFTGGTDAQKPGTGLGLYLSRQLAEIQGASLELEWTAVGRGSRFRLSFPRDGH